MTKKPIIQVVLEEKIYQLLKEECENEGRSMSNLAKKIIEDYYKNKNKE